MICMTEDNSDNLIFIVVLTYKHMKYYKTKQSHRALVTGI